MKKILFSMLSLGARFKFNERSDQTYVKISHDLKESSGCIAEWNDDLQDQGWFGQCSFSLNETDEDCHVFLVK